MEAILIPLAKGVLGLMGLSSVMFFGVRQEVRQIEMQAVQRAEIQRDARALELKEKALELKKAKPLEPLKVIPNAK